MSQSMMRAVRQHDFGGPEVLRVEHVPVPQPLPTEIRVQVRAAGVNPVDWKTRAGTGMARVLGAPPFVLGWDVSGVVDEVGFGVTTVRPGDEVYGMPWFPRAAGAYAEYVTAPSRQFARKPASIDHAGAGATPLAALTAWQALRDTAGVAPGQRVLVHAAAGGVGHLAVQFVRGLGADAIGTASGEREQFLRDLGVTQVVDHRTSRFEKEVEDVDVVLDLVGGEDYGTRSIDVIRPGGIYIGVPGGVSPQVAAAAEERGVRATGFLVEPDGAALTRIAELVDTGGVRIEVQGSYPLDRVADAHRAGETGRTRGKLVVDVTA